MQASTNFRDETSVYSRVFKSPLFVHTALLVVGSTTVKVYWDRILSNTQNKIAYLFATFVWCCSTYWKLDIFKYEISMIKTIAENYFFPNQYPWYNEIIPGKLTLGAIPLKNKDHHNELMQNGITAIMPVLEPFECYTSSFFSDPVTHWEFDKFFDLYLVSQSEFDSCNLWKIQQGVNLLNKQINSENKHSYVYSQAGRARSATLVICYLLEHGGKHDIHVNSVEDAIAYVKEKRPLIFINRQQRKYMDLYWESLKIN